MICKILTLIFISSFMPSYADDGSGSSEIGNMLVFMLLGAFLYEIFTRK